MAPAKYIAMLRRIVTNGGPVLLLCDSKVAGLFDMTDVGVRALAFTDLPRNSPLEPDPPAATEPAYVQFSSGSTSEPRGCVLTPRAIAHQLNGLKTALAIDPDDDVGVVWLPLGHDMGLFGCLLLTYWTRHRLVLSTPERFMRDPRTWFDDCAHFGATVSASPNFALEIAARVGKKGHPPSIPLRRLIVGGERIDMATLVRANALLGDERLPMQACIPAYGLAEAVLAVTMSPLGRGPRALSVESERLANGEVVPTPPDTSGAVTTVVSTGLPIDGNAIAVDSHEGVGEIRVWSASLAEGYLNDTDQTHRRFTADGLRTGDLGFLQDGELYVTGRMDDLMCVAGRNIYARDIELAIADVPGLRPGACAVVDIEEQGTTGVVVVAELRNEHPDPASIADVMRLRARETSGIGLARCIFLPKGELPKTPSGKVQRYLCRELASEGRTASAAISLA